MYTSRANSGVILKNIHVQLRKISDITATLPFTEFDFMQKYRESFAVSKLGRIYAQLPLKEMAEKIRSHNPKRHPQGNSPLFQPEGEVALMFLKSYTGQSDDGLIEMLNGSIHMQLFCGVLIDPASPIKNGKIVSAWLHSNTIENFELHQSVGDSSLCPNQPKNEFSPAEN